jgi:hypothetical protein
MLFAALCWVVGQLGLQLHSLQVQHVVCAEHGATMEVESPDEAAAELADAARIAEAPALTQDTPAEHDHDCAMSTVCDESVVGQSGVVTGQLVNADLERARPGPGAPRGPPLRYAPKTSPPALA